MIFFTSDTHFKHKNIITYCNRPFENVKEMDETMISNWNKKVKSKDTIYHLGDFIFNKRNNTDIVEEYLNKLNGKKILIIGNHDKINTIKAKGWDNVYTLHELNIDKYCKITLCHYAMRVWNKSHHGTWHLYGHSHGKLPGQGLSFDVGVDCNNFEPLSLDEISDRMEKIKQNIDRNIKNIHYTIDKNGLLNIFINDHVYIIKNLEEYNMFINRFSLSNYNMFYDYKIHYPEEYTENQEIIKICRKYLIK